MAKKLYYVMGEWISCEHGFGKRITEAEAKDLATAGADLDSNAARKLREL